ncbi:unnamed protein product [Ambrosiozyma monospora]|uniref:Elongator complex protein 5 n=1 Tax=Ambrosiozyma monospora TaxID=43982 RepID=A0A9W6Z211_AMBMO|nr:unnamed protein product [Ambrosiozyma monospora]
MSATLASSTVLLNRILTLKENSPFILALDTVVQSSQYLTKEFIYKVTNSTASQKPNIVYLSFETTNVPTYASEFIPLLGLTLPQIKEKVKLNLSQKTLIIVDSFNYIKDTELSQFLQLLISPNTIIYGTYHLSVPSVKSVDNPNKPSLLTKLQFIATTIFDIKPLSIDDDEQLDYLISNLDFPIGSSNQPVFQANVVYRRKSGRSLIYKFSIDSNTHEYNIVQNDQEQADTQDDQELLDGLTTFNLTTTQKQKLVKDQVELPYLEAQHSLGSVGGAIVYEFEKDDDYDEDDPYEDPF